MENEQIVIDELYLKYAENGYVSEDEILDLCTKYSLPFHKIDYVCDKIISMGILISDNITKNSVDEAFDYSQSDYEAIYREVSYNYPEMKFLIEYLKNIRPPQKGEIKNLSIQVKCNNKFAREKMIKMYLRLALKISVQYEEKTTISVEDLFSVACLGLIKAVDSYDVQKDTYFASYSSLWIKQYVDRYIMDRETIIRIPIYQKDKIDEIVVDSLDEIMDENKNFDLEDNFDVYEISEKNQLKEIIGKALNTLTYKEKEVIKMRFGLNDYKEYTLDDIGYKFGVTRERIRQIEARALRKLKNPRKNGNCKEFY